MISYVAPVPEDPTGGAPLLGVLLGCLASPGWFYSPNKGREEDLIGVNREELVQPTEPAGAW